MDVMQQYPGYMTQEMTPDQMRASLTQLDDPNFMPPNPFEQPQIPARSRQLPTDPVVRKAIEQLLLRKLLQASQQRAAVQAQRQNMMNVRHQSAPGWM